MNSGVKDPTLLQRHHIKALVETVLLILLLYIYVYILSIKNMGQQKKQSVSTTKPDFYLNENKYAT